MAVVLSPVAALRLALIDAPRDVGRWLSLSEMSGRAGRPDAALRFAVRASTLRPDSPTPLFACAEAHRALGADAAALDSYRRALRLPLPPDTRRQLAHLLLQGGRHADAATALRQYAVLFADAYEATREACLAASLSETPEPAELFARATDRFALPADDFRSARRPAPETARFTDGFFGSLEVPPRLDGLPPVEGESMPTGTGPTTLVTFDDGYARRLARHHVEAATRGNARYRLHLIDPAEDTLAALRDAVRGRPTVALSWERPGLEAAGWHRRLAYYSCIRFVRAREMLAHGGEVLMTDADNILRPDAAGALGDDYDLGLAADGRRIPWFSYNVSLVHLRDTTACRAFMDLVAGYILAFLRNGEARWHLDQNAFYCTADWLRRHGRAPRIASLSDRAGRMVERRIRAEELQPAGG